MTYEVNGIQGEFLTYMGKPLVREGNLIVYGDMSEAYCLQLMILTEKEVQIGSKTVKVPDGIIAQILSTDTTLPFAKRLEKQFDKNGLYDALDIGITWLNKLNKK